MDCGDEWEKPGGCPAFQFFVGRGLYFYPLRARMGADFNPF